MAEDGDSLQAGRESGGAAVAMMDDSWHERLLASLRDCDVQRAPRQPALTWLITIIVLAVIIVVVSAGRLIIKAALRDSGVPPVGIGVVVLLWYLFNILVLLRIRNRFLRTAWRTSARSAEEELEGDSSRRPVFYLRAFKLDERVSKPTWGQRLLWAFPLATAEQEITGILRKHLGPVIAIGRPEEKLPELGAARFYVSHERWQAKVEDVAKECQLVVWATGVTEGLRWEISHLIQNLPPEKLVLWLHPHLLRVTEAEREAEWTRFREQLGGLFPKPLPERLGEARFIDFGSDWTPRAVAPPRHDFEWSVRSLLGRQRSALLALLALRGTKVTRGAVGRFKRLGWAGAALVLLGILGILVVDHLPSHTTYSVDEGQIKYPYTSHRGSYTGERLLANAALIVVTLSLLWGKRPGRRRVRAGLVAGLGVLLAIFGALWVWDEHADAYERVEEQSAMATMMGDESPPVHRVVHVQRIEYGGYANLALALVAAAVAVAAGRKLWRGKVAAPAAEEAGLAPLVYAGPAFDRRFARLIGSEGVDIDWRRNLGFFAANVALALPGMLRGGYFLSPTVRAAVMTLVAIFVYRFVRRMSLAAAITAAATAVAGWLTLRGSLESGTASYLAREFVMSWLFLAGLAWAVERISPLGVALWIGAMTPLVVNRVYWALVGGGEMDFESLWLSVLGTVLFAGVMSAVVRMVEAASRGAASAGEGVAAGG